MEINNITVPDAGTTTQYIPDPIGGWLYVVTTVISVTQKHLSQVQDDLAAAQAKVVEAQAVADALAPIVMSLQEAQVAQEIEVPADTPII